MCSFGPDRPTDAQPPRFSTVGALIAAGVTAWFVSSLPQARSLSGAEAIASAFGRMLAVFLACAGISWLFSTIATPASPRAVRRLALNTSVNSLWLVPLAILIREHSLWAMVIAGILAACIAHALRRSDDQWTHRDTESPRNPFMFVPAGSSRESRQQTMALCGAFCAEIGALAGLAGHMLPSAILAGVGSALWAKSYADLNNRPAPSRSAARPLVVGLALLCTTMALIPYLGFSYGIAGIGVHAGRHLHRGFPLASIGVQAGNGLRRGHPQSQPPGSEKPEPNSGYSFGGPSDSHPGVILWPDEPKHAKLVAPNPAATRGLLSNEASADPLVIPFDGVYWVFKAPDTRPPETSRQAHGSPELYEIHSTDRRPLSMEAHQYLGNLIDLSCCSRIQIAIHNQDRYPRSVSLELVLIDSTAPGKPAQSLGRMMVQSTPPWQIYGKPAPTIETLEFSVPAKSAIRRFDEAEIVFRLDSWRSDAGARISIDRLVLVPHGL